MINVLSLIKEKKQKATRLQQAQMLVTLKGGKRTIV